MRLRVMSVAPILVGCGLLALSPFGLAQAPPANAGANVPDAPIIDDIKFAGNTLFSGERLATEIQLKQGAALSREKMKADLDRLVALYRGRGHNLSISPDIGHPAPGHVSITFKIDEHGVSGDAGPAPPAGGAGPPPS